MQRGLREQGLPVGLRAINPVEQQIKPVQLGDELVDQRPDVELVAAFLLGRDLHRFGDLLAKPDIVNDKAGAPQNLQRWTSTRSIKETFVPATDHRYPYMS